MSKTALANPSEDQALDQALAAWRKGVEFELKGASFEKKLLTRTFEGITLKPLYTRADLNGRPEHRAALDSAPGESPFLRGSKPGGYVSGPWETAQEIPASDRVEFNLRLRADLMRGQDAVVLIKREAGRPEGLPLSEPGALAAALQGVELSALPVHLDAGADATDLANRYLALAEERGVSGEMLRGSLTADPLGAWARAGSLPGTWAAGLESLAAWTKRAADLAPELRTVGVDARIWSEAGGSAVLELAAALASVVEYLRGLRERGVSLEISVPRLRVQFGAGPQFLIETAKFRAWRLILTKAVAALGGDPELAGRAGLHASTTRWNKTRTDPHVNMLRVTTEALSAVIGGVDSLTIAPFDSLDGVGGGDEFSRRIARNLHALLAEEFGGLVPADPAGGSWCVESITDDLARRAWAQFQAFENLGGFASALRAGEPQRLAAATAGEKTEAVGARRLGVVGTNLFPNLKESPLPRLACSPAKITDAQERINPAIRFRVAEGFESLRDASADFARRTGRRPRVFLAKMGPLAQHKARADFSAGFFAPGGFELLAKQTFTYPREAADAAAASGAEIVVLCSSDETYPELVPVFAASVRASAPAATIVLAGLPAEASLQDAYRQAGVAIFIHLRASVEETLRQMLRKLGAL